MKLIGTYKNGNYNVQIFDDGTKIRSTEEDDFIPAFAENCDLTITHKCDGACEFCYLGCTSSGKHGDLMNYEFIDTLHPYTELALNGNDMTLPDLIPFLKKLREKKVIANITVNQMHFEREQNLITQLVNLGLIKGLGISLRKTTDTFISLIQKYDNAVLHVINGILTKEDIDKLSNKNIKMLILGYKNLCRGKDYLANNNDLIKDNQTMLYNMLPTMLDKFNVISFDNLAIEQLNVKRLMSDKEWQEFYMGDDGKFTFYIDLVNGTFGKNSLAIERFPIMNNIDDMFTKIMSL